MFSVTAKMALRGGYGLFYNNVADGSWSFPARRQSTGLGESFF